MNKRPYIQLRTRAMFYVLCKSVRRNVNGRYGRYRNRDFKRTRKHMCRDDAQRCAKCAIKARNDTGLSVNIDCTITLLASEYARFIFNGYVTILKQLEREILPLGQPHKYRFSVLIKIYHVMKNSCYRVIILLETIRENQFFKCPCHPTRIAI